VVSGGVCVVHGGDIKQNGRGAMACERGIWERSEEKDDALYCILHTAYYIVWIDIIPHRLLRDTDPTHTPLHRVRITRQGRRRRH
jgi:hypothetical protein